MTDPLIENAGLIGDALKYVLGLLGTSVAACWTFLKADVNRAHQGNKQALDHINLLYKANEEDREKTHKMMTDMTGTFQAFVTKATEEFGKRPTRDECALFWKDAKDNARNRRNGNDD